MKKKFLFLPLLAALALAGCSEDNEPAGGTGGSGDKECGYVAVNIVQPAEMLGRATETGDFEAGQPSENEANEATFFIFDNAETPNLKNVQTCVLTSSDLTGTTNPQVERIYSAVLVIDGVTDAEKYGGEIFCVLNAPSAIKNITSVSKEDLLGKIGDYCTGHTDKNFIMSNSAYKDGETEVCGAVFADTDLKRSAAEALSSPVSIYVERVVAKVVTSGKPTATNPKPYVGANKDKELTIKITGIEIANIANTAYLFKNLGGTWPAWTGIHDTANKRSYWENCPGGLNYRNQSYLTIAGLTAAPANNVYTELSEESFALTQYVLPNTSDQKTAVLVTAQLMDGDNKADLVWIKGGYFDNAGAKQLVCQHLADKHYAVKKTVSGANPEYRHINSDDLKWSQKNGETEIAALEDYEAAAQVSLSDVNESVVLYDFSTKTESVPDKDVNAYLATAETYYAEVFVDGLCYYYVNIDQTPVLGPVLPEGTVHYDGVVRNHIYNLALNGIQGIGTAVFDPKKEIVPDKPKHDQFNYLAAKINVLKWKVVNQTVNFEGN